MSYVLTLKGRNALITGASSGLGEHFAHTLARAGATVALAARRQESLERVRKDIEAKGHSAMAIAMDVTDSTSVGGAFSKAAERLGNIDILVNNAGTTLTKPFLDVEKTEWNRVMETNLNGAFLVAQAAARIMKVQASGGAIVNIASILGLRVAGQVAPYVTSKAAVVQLTKAMALELARYRIRVNALCPGYIETELNRDFFASDIGQALIKRIPQRRLGKLEDLEAPLLLMCSDAGAYMTGAVLAVDGGHLVSSL
jgi:NAD(P)-dependent dehydrogenase (short-subunit alcohol dehydrogenase family)